MEILSEEDRVYSYTESKYDKGDENSICLTFGLCDTFVDQKIDHR